MHVWTQDGTLSQACSTAALPLLGMKAMKLPCVPVQFAAILNAKKRRIAELEEQAAAAKGGGATDKVSALTAIYGRANALKTQMQAVTGDAL